MPTSSQLFIPRLAFTLAQRDKSLNIPPAPEAAAETVNLTPVEREAFIRAYQLAYPEYEYLAWKRAA